MMTITDTLSDDLLREVFTFLPVGSFLPVAHVCKAFKRCWILSKKTTTTNGDDDDNETKKKIDMMMIYSTKPFRVGLLYGFNWNHSCYEDVPSNYTSMKRKETTANSTSTLTMKITTEEEKDACCTTTSINKKQKIETRNTSVATLNQSLFKYFVSDMGWMMTYRSLLRRKLLTKLLVMAAQRGDIEGMNYMLFQMEPIDLRTRLYRYCHRRARSQKVKSLSTSSSNEEVDADADALAHANEQLAGALAHANEQLPGALAHANEHLADALARANEHLDALARANEHLDALAQPHEQLHDAPLDDDDASLASSSWAEEEEEGEEENAENEEEEESEDEDMPALMLPSTSPYNPYNETTMVNVTPSVQELCLNMAAAGRLQALHWLLHTALQMTWLCQKDGLEVHQEAKSNDQCDVAKYIMLTMTINFSPFKAHQRSATAQLESMMSTRMNSCSTFTTNNNGVKQD